MKIGFYPKLAADGIRKNSKLYVPFVLSFIGCVFMLYIISALTASEPLHHIKGASTLNSVLTLGQYVIMLFAVIFLFYTNSFVGRRRNKEFGLYSILGMDKAAIVKIVVCETIMVSLFSTVIGLALGIGGAKLFETMLLRLIGESVDYKIYFNKGPIIMTVLFFTGVMVLLLVKTIISVWHNNPLELLKSESAGEKAPKAMPVMAVIGLIMLAVAYYLALSVKNPLSAISVFFVAVLLVIIATYILFITGSVALCKCLQRNKKYYYDKRHFVGVSTMAYRMKRNGAGLASICVLSTMVLVMIASSGSLYFGKNDSIRASYPNDNSITVRLNYMSEHGKETTKKLDEAFTKCFDEFNFVPKKLDVFDYCALEGMLEGENLSIEQYYASSDYGMSFDSRVRNVVFMPLDEYNHEMGTDYVLGENEILAGFERAGYKGKSIVIEGIRFDIVDKITEYPPIEEVADVILPAIFCIVPDLETIDFLDVDYPNADDAVMRFNHYFGYDCGSDISSEDAIALFDKQCACLDEVFAGDYSYMVGCVAKEMYEFTYMYGGLFFVGIVLSIMFICAAAVIIYYKQVSEGYEDRGRFAIMQKVGMTDEDIKKSINSQILTVFFAPLLMAGIHFCFAFPLVWKLLRMFNLHNLPFVIGISGIAFIVFALLYTAVYKATAKAYFTLVAK